MIEPGPRGRPRVRRQLEDLDPEPTRLAACFGLLPPGNPVGNYRIARLTADDSDRGADSLHGRGKLALATIVADHVVSRRHDPEDHLAHVKSHPELLSVTVPIGKGEEVSVKLG